MVNTINNLYKIGENTYKELINNIALLPITKLTEDEILNNNDSDTTVISESEVKEILSEDPLKDILESESSPGITKEIDKINKENNKLSITSSEKQSKEKVKISIQTQFAYPKILPKSQLVPAPVVPVPVVPVPVVPAPVVPVVPAPVVPTPVIQKPLVAKPLKTLNATNYTYVTGPPLVTHIIRKTNIMKGGGNKEQQLQLLLINSNNNLLANMMTCLYNTNKCIIDGDYIINILVSLLYNEFLETNKPLTEIITQEHIDSIPEMYKFNFKDKAMIDLEEKIPDINLKLTTLNENVLLIKKLLFKSMPENKLIIESPETINLKQTGGKSHKRIDKSVDKTVEEKINKNIDTVSTFLKTRDYSNKKQTGGNISTANMLLEIQSFPANPTKIQEQEMLEKSNMWVVELLEQQLATKVIKDSEYNIARFYLESIPASPVNPTIINFVNRNASILTLKDNDRVKQDIPNPIKIEKMGKAVPGNVTDKLKEYFNKKYQKLLELRDKAYKEEYLDEKPSNNEYSKIKVILSQSGGLDPDVLKEECFTSKQYSKFLEKIGAYMRHNRQKLDNVSIESIQNDIKELERIEQKLLKNNELFSNYKKIQEVYPDKIYESIRIPSHLEKVYDENKGLFDKYGNINNNIIDMMKKLEKYDEIKEATKYPNVQKEMNNLSQSGGGSKQYMKFNNFNDVERFTTKTFQRILEEMKEDK